MYEFMMLLFMVGIFIFVCHIYKLLSVIWDILKANDYMQKWLDNRQGK